MELIHQTVWDNRGYWQFPHRHCVLNTQYDAKEWEENRPRSWQKKVKGDKWVEGAEESILSKNWAGNVHLFPSNGKAEICSAQYQSLDGFIQETYSKSNFTPAQSSDCGDVQVPVTSRSDAHTGPSSTWAYFTRNFNKILQQEMQMNAYLYRRLTMLDNN